MEQAGSEAVNRRMAATSSLAKYHKRFGELQRSIKRLIIFLSSRISPSVRFCHGEYRAPYSSGEFEIHVEFCSIEHGSALAHCQRLATLERRIRE
jgi:hypothetical protein